tara:strand:+ start:1591 stop:1827 length:237 start_codon:yes stop_codon:yes gene_type:complete
MARFYGTIKGSAGEASRIGHATTGIHAHIRGWGIGVRVQLSVDSKTGQDKIHVWKTSGSAGSQPDKLIKVIGTPKEKE